jgi:hypothetical protein
MKGRFLAGGALALALAFFAVGCGDHGGSLAGFRPVGQEAAPALLLADVQPVSPLDSSQIVVDAVVYDSTAADGFRLYTLEGNGGYRPATDYVSAPTHTYSIGKNEYRMRSLIFDPTPGLVNRYIARGARGGFETVLAPLSEEAAVVVSNTPLELARRLDVPLVSPADSAETDSVPTLTWAAVPGAARYRVTITGRNGINYLVIVDGTTHKVEGANPAIRIEDLPMRPGLLYRWQVEGIDVSNRLFAKTRVTRALLVN